MGEFHPTNFQSFHQSLHSEEIPEEVKAGDDPVAGVHVVPSGRPRSLSREQEEILAGVVEKYVSHEQVDRVSVVGFVMDEFLIELTPQSIGNYMRSNHLKEKKMT